MKYYPLLWKIAVLGMEITPCSIVHNSMPDSSEEECKTQAKDKMFRHQQGSFLFPEMPFSRAELHFDQFLLQCRKIEGKSAKLLMMTFACSSTFCYSMAFPRTPHPPYPLLIRFAQHPVPPNHHMSTKQGTQRAFFITRVHRFRSNGRLPEATLHK